MADLAYTGTQVNYFLVCKRKLWFFSKGLNMEQNSDLVYMGKLIHEESYKKESKEILIDGKIKLDFVGKNLEIHEVKKSRKLEKPHLFQLLYYLYCLKQKGIDTVGVINYPLLRKKESVKLTKERELEIEKILHDIPIILEKEAPPLAEKRKYCRKCSYYQFCFA